MMKQTSSLDNWRDYFRRGDSDIFGIINHAIMVAAADCPKEFKSKRDGIAELLFSCDVSRCIGCDHLEPSIAGDEEANHGLKTKETVGVGDRDEVMRIRDILLNKEDEPDSVLLKSLRKLESMSMTVDILKDTEIGKAVNGLRKHSSDKISKLAKTLFVEWKELVQRWMNTPKEMAATEGTPESAKGTPESANLSVIDHEDAFPSPPHNLDIIASEPNGFELSQILDCLDCDGNPRHNVESKHERNLQSSARRRPEGTNKANLVNKQNKNQHMSKEEANVRHMKHSATDLDDPRRQPKQMVLTDQRKPLAVTEQKQKQKLTEPQQDKLKALDPDAKFEIAKRKLQESYQECDNAKRRRTIQVLDTIPKQSKVQKPQFKRPPRR